MIAPLIVPLHEQVEYLHIAVIRESEVANTPCLALLHKPVEDTVVDIPRVESLHTAHVLTLAVLRTHTDAVHKQIVHVIHLQLLQRVLKHRYRLLPRP